MNGLMLEMLIRAVEIFYLSRKRGAVSWNTVGFLLMVILGVVFGAILLMTFGSLKK